MDEREAELIAAAEEGSLDKVKELLALGVSAHGKDKYGKTALILAVKNRFVDCVRELIPVSNVNDRDGNGMTALMWAAKKDKLDCLKDLLEHGANPLDKDHHNWTPLMFAAWDGRGECVRELLPVSNVKEQDETGKTALMMAAWNGYEDCTIMLLPLSDVNARDIDGKSALMFARRYLPAAVKVIQEWGDAQKEKEDFEMEARVGKERLRKRM